MRVTVAVCTWNRCEVLRRSLEHMTRLVIPDTVEWEVLLVNNSCTDDTAAVAEQFARRLPLRHLREPIPGLSRARNVAINYATGEYILWTDDDALVDEHWLASYVEAFACRPEAAFFGGPIRPHFTVMTPAWINAAWSRVKGAYAERDLGSEPLPLTNDNELPWGANYAVRMTEQRHHLYDTNLGHRLASRIGGEETALLSALLADGGIGWWVPKAKVQHLIPPERLNAGYIRRYFFGHGRFLQFQDFRKKAGVSTFDRIRTIRKCLSEAVRKEALCQTRRWRSRELPWGHHLVEASIAWGRFAQAFSVMLSSAQVSRRKGMDDPPRW